MRVRVTRHFSKILAGMVVAISLSLAHPAFGGALSNSVIGMFPQQVGQFGYADLQSARKLPWFAQLRDQLLPARLRDFEQFLRSAGMDPDSQVQELAWAQIGPASANSGEILGVALGQFNPAGIEDYFKRQKLPVIEDKGYHLLAFGSGAGAGDLYFSFLDANTAAFGQRDALDKLFDVRGGSAQSLLDNDQMNPLINEANGNGMIWAVLDKSYTHLAVEQLLPQASQFPQAAQIINRLQAMKINVDADDGIDARFEAVCASVQDANLLSAALQAGIMYRRYQETQNDPALADALNQVRITPAGDRLRIDAPVSQDQLMALIRSRTFASPM